MALISLNASPVVKTSLLANTRGQRQRLWEENRRENLPDGSRSP